MTADLPTLIDAHLPLALESLLGRALGEAIPRDGPGLTCVVASAGRFAGRNAPDFLTRLHDRKANVSLVLAEHEDRRILYFRDGVVVGGDGNVLFERLARILGKEEVLNPEDAKVLLEYEEHGGVASAARLLPDDAVRWGLEARVRAIACGVFFMPRAYYVLVDGVPDLGGLPRLNLQPMELVMEGLRRYDEWRHGTPREDQAAGTATTSERPRFAARLKDLS